MLCQPMLGVKDVAASANWYKQLLAAENDHGGNEFDRIVSSGKVLLMLHHLPAPDHGMREPTPETAGSGMLLWIYVDDLDAVFQRAVDLQAEFITQPRENPLAHCREFTLADPDGYRLVIAQPFV